MVRLTRTCFVFLLANLAAGAADADRLDDAVKRLTKEAYGTSIEDLDDYDVEEVAENVLDVAEDIRDSRSDDPERERHIKTTWGSSSRESRRHISKCPYCRPAAVEAARNTPLEDIVDRRIPDQIPRCFWINGRPFGAGSVGELYPIHPQTGQVIGPAEGTIWFAGGRYIGVNLLGRQFSASPCR